ncbi:DUF6638 family protein [Maritimibacter sp. UBA3975]|uniref:DUF6638 family protein n=1 Tax=Maritimibacter sp. UBA3975 TaxID=1946833 RepID=UPI000C095F97|nr:DUF6638 family protein [Maritimibacter sp. UBA3975]MAM63974.1 hypothetical protein [Maritimibacter sp.]|tara:strand:+ start:6647 stop:7996 length:1350 start_codon:yes stop_codon:yes gene_type:complete
MKRLIQRGLMFGNLIRVDSPALIERYNRALHGLTGKRTELDEFHIDISGYSYEVGEALGDHLYLNPNGVNRLFIILTTEQNSAPLLNAKFSTSRGILRQFIEENEAKLFALTAHDAVAGELDNSVFEASEAARLLDIRTITVNADTTQSHVKNARALADKIERFQSAEDAWFDDVLIAEMIGLAKQTGDVTRQPIDIERPTYQQDNFWTALFGGLYVFRDVAEPAVIAVGDKDPLGVLPIETTLDFADRNGIAAFLEVNELVEPIIKARGVDGAAILRQKMDFILVDAATTKGVEIDGMDHRALHRLAQRMGSDLPEEFLKLNQLVRWALNGGKWPRIASDDDSYFYTLRARPDHPDRDLINMMLSELAPLDIRQLFICHKQAFYAAYADWPDAKKEYVAEFLYRDYAANKAGAREALFGGEEPPAKPVSQAPKDDIIDLVGPWGAVRR